MTSGRAALPVLRGRALGAACLLLAAFTQAAAQDALRWPSEGPPRPLAARDVNFPPYYLQTLPNGLQVVAVLHHEQPVVSMRMIVRSGGALDPADKLGLASLTAALLTQGTTSQSASELNDAIDFIGSALGTGAGTDLSFLNMIVMKDSFETGLRMLSDVARRPAFAPEEIDRQRQQILSSLRVSLEDPEFVADAVFRRLVYGFHPYAWPQIGTPATLASLTRDDLVAFHRRYFVPNNAILAVVGDVTKEEAFEGVRKAFGDWERRDVPEGKALAPPDPTRRLIVVNKPDAVQTEVRVGHVGVRRNHSDYMALNLAIRILGGEGANRLHQVLRTERGLTYGAQAKMDTFKDSGDFEAATSTRSAATGEVLRLVVDQFWRLQRERVGERELADAKAYLTGSFPLTIETPDAIATQVLNVLFYGLPVQQLQSFRERVNAVTVDDIRRVSRYYLRPDRLAIVLVGQAAAVAPQLRRVGFGTFETVEIADLDLTTVDFKRPLSAARRFQLSPVARPSQGGENRRPERPAPKTCNPFGGARHQDQLTALSCALRTPELSGRLLLSCGEASGDLYAGALTRELRSLVPEIAVSGLGGPQLAAAGGRLIADYRGLAVTGLTEALWKVARSLATLGQLLSSARSVRPDALIVIDFPDFNFPLARRVKRLGVPVVYYVSPQVWAWRPGRVKTIREFADRVLVIFPFEEPIYRGAGVPVEFVGHPLVDLARPSMPREALLGKLGLKASAPTVAVLPGSRANEVDRILPDLAAASRLIRARVPDAQFIVARAPNLEDDLFTTARNLAPCAVVEGETDAVLAAADVALTASGTATVQAALHNTPMVVVYRLSSLTYHLGRRLVNVETYGMVNLIAGERIVPELIQDAFTPEAVASEAVSMLTDRERVARIREGLARVRARLGGPGASRRAAEAILKIAK